MDKFFITTPPKSGTHLLSALVEEVTGEKSISVKNKKISEAEEREFSKASNLVGHHRIKHLKACDRLYRLFAERKILIMIRDPRDLCNSMLHYLMKSQNLNHQSAARELSGLEFNKQIIKIANGFTVNETNFSVPDIRCWCSGFIELQKEFDQVFVFHYEDFFQEEKVIRLIQNGFEMNYADASTILKSALQKKTKTKRDGGAMPNQWERTFGDELKKFFDDEFGDLITSFGYLLAR